MTDSRTSIVLTRHTDQNRPWVQRLQSLGLSVLEMPLLEFEMLEAPSQKVTEDADWILFTSPRGVHAFVDAGLKAEGCRVGCLGTGTAAALAEHGIEDHLGFSGKNGEELAQAFKTKINPPAKVLLPGPVTRINAPLEILREAGFTVLDLPLYRTVPVAPTQPPGTHAVIFFCSPSAVRSFAGALEERPECIAIGETTARTCRELGFPVRVADKPDLESMLQAAGLGAFTPETEFDNESD